MHSTNTVQLYSKTVEYYELSIKSFLSHHSHIYVLYHMKCKHSMIQFDCMHINVSIRRSILITEAYIHAYYIRESRYL